MQPTPTPVPSPNSESDKSTSDSLDSHADWARKVDDGIRRLQVAIAITKDILSSPTCDSSTRKECVKKKGDNGPVSSSLQINDPSRHCELSQDEDLSGTLLRILTMIQNHEEPPNPRPRQPVPPLKAFPRLNLALRHVHECFLTPSTMGKRGGPFQLLITESTPFEDKPNGRFRDAFKRRRPNQIRASWYRIRGIRLTYAKLLSDRYLCDCAYFAFNHIATFEFVSQIKPNEDPKHLYVRLLILLAKNAQEETAKDSGSDLLRKTPWQADQVAIGIMTMLVAFLLEKGRIPHGYQELRDGRGRVFYLNYRDGSLRRNLADCFAPSEPSKDSERGRRYRRRRKQILYRTHNGITPILPRKKYKGPFTKIASGNESMRKGNPETQSKDQPSHSGTDGNMKRSPFVGQVSRNCQRARDSVSNFEQRIEILVQLLTQGTTLTPKEEILNRKFPSPERPISPQEEHASLLKGLAALEQRSLNDNEYPHCHYLDLLKTDWSNLSIEVKYVCYMLSLYLLKTC